MNISFEEPQWSHPCLPCPVMTGEELLFKLIKTALL